MKRDHSKNVKSKNCNTNVNGQLRSDTIFADLYMYRLGLLIYLIYESDISYKVCQGERTKFDRFVDSNVRGAQRRVYSNLRIYRN